jgi:hypothetical protein
MAVSPATAATLPTRLKAQPRTVRLVKGDAGGRVIQLGDSRGTRGTYLSFSR